MRNKMVRMIFTVLAAFSLSLSSAGGILAACATAKADDTAKACATAKADDTAKACATAKADDTAKA